jgi:hypothetical protein
MAIAVVVLILLCFGSATIHCVWDRGKTIESVRSVVTVVATRPRRTMQLGAVTCEVVAFEDFELIKTSEHDLDAAGW